MNKKGMIIAITGQSGCGKSTLSSFYRSKGFTVIDCDEAAKSARELEDCQKELARRFGEDVIKNGSVDTRLLSKRAFDTRENLDRLTKITHPYIIRQILFLAENAFDRGEKLVFVDGAVIIGYDFEKYCDKFIVVVADEEKLLQRIKSRDIVEDFVAKNRIAGQIPYGEMIKKADYVINNNTDIQSLIVQGSFVLEQIIRI